MKVMKWLRQLHFLRKSDFVLLIKMRVLSLLLWSYLTFLFSKNQITPGDVWFLLLLGLISVIIVIVFENRKVDKRLYVQPFPVRLVLPFLFTARDFRWLLNYYSHSCSLSLLILVLFLFSFVVIEATRGVYVMERLNCFQLVLFQLGARLAA